MPLRRSFEKSEGRFAGGGGTAAQGEPSGTWLPVGSGSGDDIAGVGVVGRGDVGRRMLPTCLSPTSILRRGEQLECLPRRFEDRKLLM
jgi:hypothetical protein